MALEEEEVLELDDIVGSWVDSWVDTKDHEY